LKTFKFLHRWLGVIAALFIILFAASGIILNHRSFFSGVDINRRYLPKTYHYHNWNLSSLKSATPISPDSLLIYGNTGIWITDSLLSHFEPFDKGLNRGIDNRRTSVIRKTADGTFLAGTMSGLFYLEKDQWLPVALPSKEKRITGITENEEAIWVMTRSELVRLTPMNDGFKAALQPLPFPADFKRETSLFRALWVIHSGKILGLPGKLLVDLMGIIMIFLSITGIIWFIAPDMMKALKDRITTRKRLVRINRFSFKWHNLIGIWSLVFLIVLTVTGMFLRPPLLIPIVRSTFPAVKHTILDHPNPWYDKLRDVQFDRLTGYFVFSTSEGFYASAGDFADSLRRIAMQPPVSVMGINVFEQPADGEFIVGSFNGIYQWKPSLFQLSDFISGMPVQPSRGMANPFGSVPVAGYFEHNQQKFLFDYNAGFVPLTRNTAFNMPDVVRNTSPMSLWNLALEVHTGRFYSFVFGNFYILFIPLAGLSILIILISGLVLWIRKYRKSKQATTC
jgi:hypothetical protein